MTDRRGVLAGLGASVLGVAAWADGAEAAKKPLRPGVKCAPLFAAGPLADNQIAQTFFVPPEPMVWPKNTRLHGPDGITTIEAFRGKLLLVALWAEWCPPCRGELPGLAYHYNHGGNGDFQIMPILTSSHAFSNIREAKAFLASIGAKDMPTFMDLSPDVRQLGEVMTDDPRRDDQSGGLPCSLLIDRDGVIRGKAIGGAVQKLADGKEWNLWATNVGQAFVAGLAKGQLPLA